ncbi:terminase small subunit [Azospirillum palustre]
MAEINWLEVRAGYEAGIPVRKLAAEFGIGSAGTISKRADREGWAKPLRPGDLTGTGKPLLTEKRERAKKAKQRKRKQETAERVSKAVSDAPPQPDDDDADDRDGLSERERRFVLHYACTGNGAVAARRAGYPFGSAKKRAAELMQRPRVLEAIEEQRAERMARLGISADRVVEELARVGLASMASIAKWSDQGVELNASDDLSPDDAAAIVEVSETKDGVKVKLAPKLQALKLLAEHTGVIGKRGEKSNNQVVINVVERGKRG